VGRASSATASSSAYLKDVVSQVELRDEDGKLVRTIESSDARQRRRSRRTGRRPRLLLVPVVHLPDRDLRDERPDRQDVDLLQAQGPVDPSKYVVEQLFATSKDGTRVPFFVVHAKDLARTARRRPSSTATAASRSPDAVFATSIYPWLEHGGIWVVPTCAAAASTARSGTATGCATRSRTSSTTTSRSPRSS
jgi:prolyl oligopeptidase